jgi:LPXTG-motif cell wall-anchored protein
MRTKYFKITTLLIALTLLLSNFTIPAEAVGAAPSLGTVSTYGLLGTTTTVTGQTIIKGDLGSGGATGTATVNGATNVANGAYTAAKIDLDAAITAAAAQPADFNGAAAEIGGLTLTPGVYKYTGAVNIGSNTTLSGNGVYIFQIDGAFTTAAGTVAQLTNGAQPCDIFWVANVATIGANSTLAGTVMSKSAITLGANSVTNGRILAQTAVTANAANTQINVPSCAATVTPTPTPSMTPIPSSTPVPSSTPLPSSTPAPSMTQLPSSTQVPSMTALPSNTPVPSIKPVLEVVTPIVTMPQTQDNSKVICEAPALHVLLNPNGSININAKLPNDATGTGTWNFNLGGKMYKVNGNEAISYKVMGAPVGTYKIGAQFKPNNNGPIVNLESCTVSVPTITGGQLPNTATPWYNLLFIGAVLSTIGGVFWSRRKAK